MTNDENPFPAKLVVWKWLSYERYREAIRKKETFVDDHDVSLGSFYSSSY